ncbi:MAG: DNA adenine methylase [Elusimicrobia bacterium]|nr:DNA adenine methylase [Elusimicrobiota bacterium]
MTAAHGPFPWFGGKDRLARAIVDLIPSHLCYVEPFGGGASVLFAKRPSPLEVYNDLNGGCVLFFRILRDQPGALQERLALTPYAREEYTVCRETWSDPDLDEVEQARRWYVATFMAFGGGGRTGRWLTTWNRKGPASVASVSGWKRESPVGFAQDRGGRKHGSRARTFAWRVDRLHEFANRLRRVQIENRPAREVIDYYDSPDTCFYLDPPYIPATRRSGSYAHEMTLEDHEALVKQITGLRGSVLVSGYDHNVYRQLEQEGFVRHEWTVALQCENTTGPRQKREEVLWRRVSATQHATLFDSLLTESGAA